MYSLKGKYVDFDRLYKFQCMDLAVDYVYHITNGTIRMWGNAKDSIKTYSLKVGKLLRIPATMFHQWAQ